MARVYSTQLLTALSVTGSTETQTVPVGFTQVIRQTIVTLGVESTPPYCYVELDVIGKIRVPLYSGGDPNPNKNAFPGEWRIVLVEGDEWAITVANATVDLYVGGYQLTD